MGRDASESAFGIRETAEKLQQAGTADKLSIARKQLAKPCRATVKPGAHQNRGSTASAPGAARDAKDPAADATQSAVMAGSCAT